MKPLVLAIGALLSSAALFAADVVRTNIVVGVGEEAVHPTVASIATVTSPAGTNIGASQVVRAIPEQYGQNLLLRGVKKGEAKLLVESTASRVSEVLNVSVVDKAVAARYRAVVGALANVDGIQANDIIVSDKSILITGTTYSAADQARCLAQETSGKGVSVVCAARLSSATVAVLPTSGYVALPNVTFTEEFSEASGELIAGSERSSNWIAELKLGDVPVMLLSSPGRGALASKAGTFVTKLRRAVAEWKKAADEKNRIYPVLASSRRTGTGYELSLVWRLDQGTRGQTLVELTFDELQKATASSGSSSDQLTDWWAASLQDAFRLYFMGSIPLRTGSVSDSPLMRTYRAALRLDPTPFNRANAPARIARGYTSVRWESGTDPFDGYVTRVPQSFQGTPR